MLSTFSISFMIYNALGHTPALAGGARELRFCRVKKVQFVTVMGVSQNVCFVDPPDQTLL